eukprot:TRINITY_DN33537_c0_g1_i1.p1 TRINITY_DN33537_c0_g1~~TRINITY_DN33537_c0_g1_i1.p1  ORF type:complete len:111 (+),score=24.62 TRINITY_DN33537_c0_g1_i1:62-394(+)
MANSAREKELLSKLFGSGDGDAQAGNLSSAGRKLLQSIHPELYTDVALLMLFTGLVVGLHFFYYEVKMLKRPVERQSLPQLCLALVSSTLLGLGYFFLMASADLYAVSNH